MTLASTASAQPPRPGTAQPARPKRVRDALKGEALAAFDRASALFGDGNFAAARVEFERAHQLSGEPRVLYNVAVCDKALKKYARAIDRLKQSLAEGKDTLPREYVDKTNDTIATLAPFVTTLALTCDQEGAAVFVDDEPVGTTPLAPIAIDVGDHTVVVRKAGFADLSTRVSAPSGAPKTLSVGLDPLVKRGTLSVTVTGLPPGARAVVVVDGAEVGEAPWSGDVDAGRRNVIVRAEGFGAPARTVDVGYRARADVTVLMMPVRAFGKLRVVTDDARDDITLDGRPIGRGRFEGEVEAGTHALKISRSGAEPYVADVVVRRDETRSLSIQLKSSGEVPTWIWVSGGIVLAGTATAAVLLLTSTKKYEGSSAGTLSPKVIPAFGLGGQFR